MRWLKSPPVWVGMGILVLAAIILHRIPHATEVRLHLVTENLAFDLPGTAPAQPLLEGVSLMSLTVYGGPSLTLDVEALRQQGRVLEVPGNRLTISAGRQTAWYTLRALPEGELRLASLELAGASEVLLSTDRQDRVQVDVQSPQASRLELAVVGGRFTLLVDDDIVLRDGQGRDMPLRPAPSPRHLEVTPASSRLVLEPRADESFGLVLSAAGQQKENQPWDLSRAFGRLRMTNVTFPSREARPRGAVVREFWGEPLVPEAKAKTRVVVELQGDDTFLLQSLRVSNVGLVCEIAGTTRTVRVGEEKSRENLVPSWLEYLVNHVVFQTVCKPLGLC
jgi:hypothetical protein